MSKKLILFHLIITFILLFSSCKSDKKSPFQEDYSLEIVRFEKLLMEMDTSNIRSEFLNLKDEYIEFSEIFFSKVLLLPGFEEENDTFYYYLKEFISDSRIREIYKMTEEQYGSFNIEKKAFIKAFGEAQKWFPEMTIPNIYTYISEFSLQKFIFQDGQKDGIGIGLDLMLGEDFNYAKLEQGTNSFSNYLTRTYNKDHLIKKVMESWIEDQMGLQSGNRLVDQMLYNGKKLYLLDQIIEEADSIILEYTAEQMDWMEQNESELWAFFIENNWFYSTDQYVIKRLTQPAPNSTAIGMPSGAPGQTGNYLGKRIVESYMKRYPETDLNQLLSIDAQKLLEASKFKPGRK